MQAQTGESTENVRNIRGRKDRNQQEKVITMGPVKEKLPHLIKLHNAHKDTGKDLSDAIKAVAEKSGLFSSVVRKFVAAKAGELFDDKKREAEQLAIIFEDIQ